MGNASVELTLYGCVVSVSCVCFASFDVVFHKLYDSSRNVGLWQLSD